MIAVSKTERFKNISDAKQWLSANEYKPVRNMKSWYMSEKYSAKLELIPASGKAIVSIGLSDKG